MGNLIKTYNMDEPSEKELKANICASEEATTLPAQSEDNDEYPSVDPKGVPTRETRLRWVILFLGSFFLFGSCVCYDIPSALSIFFEDPNGPYHYKKSQIGLLYSVYSLPNTILPLLGGIAMDKIGVKTGLMTASSLVVIGQLIFTIGGNKYSYNT